MLSGCREGPSMAVPLQSNVYCRDGYCGRSTYVVMSPLTDRITHVVVECEQPPLSKRLVPVALIEEVQPKAIFLSCDSATLAKQDPFVETYYIRVEELGYDDREQGHVVSPNTAWRVIEA
jgi:hypothetical protein